MTVRVTSLASGSSGNALLLQSSKGALLIDCGLPQRTIERRLRHAGMSPADLSAIVLTHEHSDHSHSAGPLARRHGIPIIANRQTVAALRETLAGVEICELAVGASAEIDGCSMRSFPVPHDAAAPVGYTISADGWCVGVAVDLGSWDAAVLEGLAPADLVVIEANHDRERLRFAPYAWPVKQRIYSPLGHLDNVESGALLARLGADGKRRTAWLAHLSEHANSPQIAVRAVEGVLKLASVDCIAVSALPRHEPLSWQSDRYLVQQELFS